MHGLRWHSPPATCCLLLIIVAISAVHAIRASPSNKRFGIPSVFQPAIRNPGLYNASDEVVVVTASKFQSLVFRQEYGTLLEFYNTFCGFCQKYAPHWKQFASDVSAWRGVVQVAALDCADDQNSALCREYEVMGYPTLRYFGPQFVGGGKPANYGQSVNKTDDIAVLRATLAALVRNTSAEARAPHWPQLLDGTVERPLPQLFDAEPRLDDRVQLAFVLYEPADSWVATELALDFYANRQVHVHRVHSAEVAATYGLHRTPAMAAVNGQLERVTLGLRKPLVDRAELRETIRQYLSDRGLALKTSSTTESLEGPDGEPLDAKRAETVRHVLAHDPTVYWADLENAVWYALEHELPQMNFIQEDAMVALRMFLKVLSRYSPLRTIEGVFFLQHVSYEIRTRASNYEIRGAELKEIITRLKNLWELPAQTGPSHQPWVGCLGSDPNKRGFTCGLWTLFHYLTVQAARNDPIWAMHAPRVRLYNTLIKFDEDRENVPPSAVLFAIHEYIRHFFGCSGCSQHFQQMAAKRHMANVTGSDEAVLWLWRAHNEVNARLAGDLTEDPVFPKRPWPTADKCRECRRDNGSDDATVIETADWREVGVLEHMRHVYVASNCSRYGLVEPIAATSEDASFAGPAQPLVAEQRRMLDGVFSDGDMRLGILLYVFCIGMLVVAVKMFMRRRGYRKKLYTHDFMGKV